MQVLKFWALLVITLFGSCTAQEGVRSAYDAKKPKPNLLFILTDQQRRDTLGRLRKS